MIEEEPVQAKAEAMEAEVVEEEAADKVRIHLGRRCFHMDCSLCLVRDADQLGNRFGNRGRNYRRIFRPSNCSSYHICWPAACRHPQPLNHQHL